MTMSLLLEYFNDLLATPENAEQMKQVILQLAVQGKLVLQNPKDEPASELIKRIQDDKLQNLENRRISQEFAKITLDTEKIPFPLPESWEWVAVNDVCYLERGITFPSSAKEDIPTPDNIACLRTASIQDEVVWNNLLYVDRKYVPSENKIVRQNDVLISMANSYDLVGKVCFVDKAPVEATLGGFISTIRCFKGVLPKYLLYVFRSAPIQRIIQGTSSQTTNIANISLGKIYPLPFPLPPLAEQQRIVARVEELFSQTRALAKELEHSQIELDGLNKSALSHLLASETPEEFNQHWDFIAEHFDLLFQAPEHVAPLRQSILELAVRGKLTRREAGDESAGELLKRISEEKAQNKKKETIAPIKESDKSFELPDGWEWTRLVSIADIGTGSTPLRSNPDYFFKGSIPWATSSVTNNPFVSKTDELITEEAARDTRLRLYPKHTLLVALYGQGKTRGQVSELLIDSTVNQACAALMFNGHAENLRAYVKLFLLKNYREIRLLAEGGAQPNLNLDKIKQTVLPLPPLAEQERIVKRVEQLLSLCDALEARFQSAEEERGRLVAAVMSTVGG